MSSTTTGPSGGASALKRDAVGVAGIVFFVLSAQAPLTGVVGTAVLAVALGNGAGAPGAFVVVGLVFTLFAVGLTAIVRHIDSRGGFYAVIRAGLGVRLGSAGSWLALLSYQAVQTAMYALLGASAAGFAEQYWGWSVPWWVYTVASVGIVYFFGIRNIELGARVLAALVMLEFLILLMFAAVVAVKGGAHGLDVGGSFSPSAIFSGAPGIGVMFAIGAMFGFESAVVYSTEARDPARTIPRATYLSIAVITVFFGFVTWMVVAYYGSSNVLAAAGAALESGDSSSFVIAPLVATLGSWSGFVASALLCTSLLAGVLAFHNLINRYLHAIAENGGLPAGLRRTNKQHAPVVAATVQVTLTLITLVPFVALDKDPVATAFSWFAGQSITALVALYCLAALAIIVFFRSDRHGHSVWTTLIAPGVALIAMVAGLGLILTNFDVLVPGSPATIAGLLIPIPVVFTFGWLIAGRTGTTRSFGLIEPPVIVDLVD
jgi:amino acid transporter